MQCRRGLGCARGTLLVRAPVYSTHYDSSSMPPRPACVRWAQRAPHQPTLHHLVKRRHLIVLLLPDLLLTDPLIPIVCILLVLWGVGRLQQALGYLEVPAW